MICWFSGSGNTLWLARQLAQATNDRLVDMADAVIHEKFHYHLAPSERLGIVFPVYAWNLPCVVRTFLQHLQIEESCAGRYIYMACTYGDDMGMTEREAVGVMKKKGWHIDSFYSVQMPNTYVCLPGFDTDSDSIVAQKTTKAEIHVKDICKDIQDNISGKRILFPGSMPRTKTYLLGWFFRKFLMSSKPFHTESSCVGCGICAKVCPLHNISIHNGHPHWNNRCAMCLACYHHCPHHAVAYNFTRKKGQWTIKHYPDREK